MASTLQERIDALTYPPTHTYRLEGLVPTGDLAARIETIEREFPDFFGGGRTLLDVGCNKGFFSLYHDGPVVGIDPERKCVDLCRALRPSGEFHTATFGSFQTDRQFDRIFIGNGPHYLFIEAGGWDWVAKLARLSAGQVLLEGPLDMSGRDAQRCIPPALAPLFDDDARRAAFQSRFMFRKRVRSPLVDRYFTLFKRKDALYYDAARYPEYLIANYRRMAAAVSSADVVMEIGVRHDRGVFGRMVVPHRQYLMVDRDPTRPGMTLDAVRDPLPACDVAISTAVLHHTAPFALPALLGNIAKNTRRLMIFTGPNAHVMPELFGDHRYHLDADHLADLAARIGWRVSSVVECGLTKPLCEIMVTLCRA